MDCDIRIHYFFEYQYLINKFLNYFFFSSAQVVLGFRIVLYSFLYSEEF